MRRTIKTISFILLSGSFISACSLIPEAKKIDYKSATKAPTLEVPPDLTSASTDERFAVPDTSARGSATFSAYNKDRSASPQRDGSNLLPELANASVERAGSQRWLVDNAWAEGVGERLTPIELPAAWYVLASPGVHASTAGLFQATDLTRDAAPATISGFLSGTALDNAFEPVLRRREPAVEALFAVLARIGTPRLTGSGSGCFVEFATREVYFSGATNSGQTVLIHTAPAVTKSSGKVTETKARELVILLTFHKRTTEAEPVKKPAATKKPATSKLTPVKKKK